MIKRARLKTSHLARLDSLAWMATSSNVLTSADRWQGRSNMIKPYQGCATGAPTPSRVCRIHTTQQPSNLGKAQRHLLLLPPWLWCETMGAGLRSHAFHGTLRVTPPVPSPFPQGIVAFLKGDDGGKNDFWTKKALFPWGGGSYPENSMAP